MRRKHDARAMARHLALRERRGLTWAQLSARTGIAISTLQWWRSRLEQESREHDAPFVELAVGPAVPSPSAFEVVFDSLSVRVPPDFDADELGRLLRSLGVRC